MRATAVFINNIHHSLESPRRERSYLNADASYVLSKCCRVVNGSKSRRPIVKRISRAAKRPVGDTGEGSDW